MPKRPMTNEERRLLQIKQGFRNVKDVYNAINEYSANARVDADNFENTTNLGYYRESGADGYAEKEEYAKLEFMEKYKQDLVEKYDKYLETYDKLSYCYDKTVLLQTERIEREQALDDQKVMIEKAELEGAKLDLDPISLDVEGLSEIRKEFTELVNEVNLMAEDIQNMRKEETLNAKTDEFLDNYRKTHPREVEKEEVKTEPKKEEPKKEEPINKVDPEEEKKKARLNTLDIIEGKIQMGEGFSDDNQKTLDALFNEYAGKDYKEGTKTYECNGIAKKLTLKEAMDTFSESKIQSEERIVNYRKNEILERNSEYSDKHFKQGVDAVNELYPNIKDIRQRVNKLSELSDHVRNNVDYISDYHTNPDKYSELVGLTNKLAQIHHQNAKPGFFSRLFNTKYNKAYNEERGLLEYYKDQLKGSKINPEYVDKITDKNTCYQGIDKKEMLDNFYDYYKKASPSNILFQDPRAQESNLKNLAKLNVVKDMINGKSPVDSMNEYFKEASEKGSIASKENNLEESKDNSRVKMEINELSPEKQSLEKEEIKEIEPQPERSNDGPSKN